MSITTLCPMHETAKNIVSVPTVVDYELTFGEKKLRSAFVQWFGQCDGPNELPNEQFFFDMCVEPDDPIWMDKLSSFRVVFIGQIMHWPKPEFVGRLIQMMRGSAETDIVWLLSPVCVEPGRPSSPSMKIVALGDPNFGVIRPKLYSDLSIRDQVMAEVEANLPLAEKLLRDPRMELPPEDIAWLVAPPACSYCQSFEHSYDEKPAVPIGGSCHDFSYVCRHCGRRWWQFNDYYHLWKHVTNHAEWDSIRRQQILKDAGYEFPEQ